MGRKYLGDHFDIHTGGVDHIPVHHENEIAQNEALTGDKAINYWMHGEFMLVNNGKMSKSLGNTYTIDQLMEMGYQPEVFRYFCLNAHYRKKLNFTFEGMDAAKVAYERLCAQLIKHKNADEDGVDTEGYYKAFKEAVSDDLNIPLALGVLWTMLKNKPGKNVYKTALKMDEVFGLSLDKVKEEEKPTSEAIPSEVTALCEERMNAKKAKNYGLADELRAKITALGYKVTDVPGGYTVEKA